MQDTKPLALVTGASSGIGAAFARRLARDGYGLILVARRRDRLEEVAREVGGAEILPADLTKDDDLHEVEQCVAGATRLEMLVNNAGFGTMGLFVNADLALQEQMQRLHVLATLRLS